ncbi:sulfatase [Vibrio maritimus]|uniref:sulfatase family protein n=1 Tax=Vibrio maritimus TaxID=990268 RepID=UPI003735858E
MNIVYILCDELRADSLGYMGNEEVQTPHIDALAQDSVIFENAYCNSPMCVPSRVSLATGRHALSHGAIDNMLKPKPSEVSLASLLQQAGYDTFNHGKWHSNIDPLEFGMARSHSGLSDLRAPESHVSCFGISDKATREGAEYFKNNGEVSLIISGTRPSHKDDTLDTVVTKNFIREIEAIKDQGSPMFAHLSIMDPHTPYLPAEPYASMYDPNSLAMPESINDDLASKPRLQRYFYHARGFDQLQEQDYRKTKAAYYGSISHVDERVGMVTDYLKQQGLYDSSLIVFTADHGSMMGEHGFVEKWGHLYEPVVRVPLLIKLPDNQSGGKRLNSFVESVDIMPTILDLLKLPIEDNIHGVSLLPYIQGQISSHKNRVFAQYFCQGLQDESALMVRDETWKLTVYPCGGTLEDKLFVDHPLRMSPLFDGEDVLGELYNLKTDPNERINLFNDPNFSNIKFRYIQDIDNWITSLGDSISFNGKLPSRMCGMYSLLQGSNMQRLDHALSGENKLNYIV